MFLTHVPRVQPWRRPTGSRVRSERVLALSEQEAVTACIAIAPGTFCCQVPISLSGSFIST